DRLERGGGVVRPAVATQLEGGPLGVQCEGRAPRRAEPALADELERVLRAAPEVGDALAQVSGEGGASRSRVGHVLAPRWCLAVARPGCHCSPCGSLCPCARWSPRRSVM